MKDFIKKFDVNENGRDFVAGDIHGCYDDLMQKLDDLQFNTAVDRLFCVGDLCDRGPNSIKCLNLIYEDWFHTVYGNHEWLWTRAQDAFYEFGIFERDNIDARLHYQIFIANGGEIVGTNLVFTEEKMKQFVKDVENLPRVIEVETKTGKVGIIHAHMPFNDWNDLYTKEWEVEDMDNQMLWKHAFFRNKEYEDQTKYIVKNIDRIYHGHTITHEVIQFANRYYIDTGSFLKYNPNPNKTGEITILEI